MSHQRGYTAIKDQHTSATFNALVDAIIPRSMKHGTIDTDGAINQCVGEYVIWELEYTLDNLSKASAQLLDIAATRLITTNQAKYPQNYGLFLGGGPFSTLARSDRIRATALIEHLDIDLAHLPPPYQNNEGFTENSTNIFNQLSMFGFYSEWPGYGSTRLLLPPYRKLTYFPVGWRQTGYPGPAFGYRALRGYLLYIDRKGGMQDS